MFVARQRSGSKLNTVFDADGNEIEVKLKMSNGLLPTVCEQILFAH